MADATPHITVIVPTRGRPTALAACLAALEAQSLPRAEFEVVVVDDGSTPADAALIAALAAEHGAQYLRQPASGPSAARNLGAAHAHAPYLAFTAEEVWSWWQTGSVHRAPWPTSREVHTVSGADAEAQAAHSCLSIALAEIRRAKTDRKVSVGTEVLAVTYSGPEAETRALALVERDLRAAARTGALTLPPVETADQRRAEVTLKPVEAS